MEEDSFRPTVCVKVPCLIWENGTSKETYSFGYIKSIYAYHQYYCAMISPFKEYFEAIYPLEKLLLVNP